MISGKTIRNWPIEEQYPLLNVPETWESIVEFANWYIGSSKPILIPFSAEVVVTDDASAITLFRKGNFQVELYLIKPGYIIPMHSHPDVDVITMGIGGGETCGPLHPIYGTGARIGQLRLTEAGTEHGGGQPEHKGFALLAFEHWKSGTPSSAAMRWEGPTAGPIHDELLKNKKDKY